MKLTEAVRTCPMCGKESMVTLFGDEINEYRSHYLYGEAIQSAMPGTDPAVREFLRLTNNPDYEAYCNEDMEMIFGHTSDRIKDYIPVVEIMDIPELGDDEYDVDRETYEGYYNDLAAITDYIEGQDDEFYGTVNFEVVRAADYAGAESDILYKTKSAYLVKKIAA